MAMLDPVIIGDATLWHGDCLEVIARMPENSIAAIVCDPPYLLNFMGKAFDKQHKALPGENEGQKMQACHARWVAEAFRILKPGGYLVAFGGDRTHHRLLVAMEDAGFELRQNCYWAFGAGFPKSQNAGKALDRKAGAKRDVVGKYMAPRQSERGIFRDEWPAGSYEQHGKIAAPPTTTHITAPATEAARKWEGFGSALKPAVEPICVGRKPMIGTLAENLLEWGCGALNIDQCRIKTTDYLNGGAYCGGVRPTSAMGCTGEAGGKSSVFEAGTKRKNPEDYRQPSGRYPSHLLHDNSPEVVAMFPQSSITGKRSANSKAATVGGTNWLPDNHESTEYTDSGSSARFFQSCPYDADDHNPLYYSGKAAKRDRDEGCGLSYYWLDGIELIWDNNSINNLSEVLLWECPGQNQSMDWDGEVIPIKGIFEGTTQEQEDSDSLTQLSGNCITGLFLKGILFTTSTEKRQTIESKTLSWLIDLPTNESTADAIKMMLAYGLSHAEIAALQNLLKKITTSGGIVFPRGAKNVVRKTPQTINARDALLQKARNVHISVKPTSLMRWLVRLFVPPGETVLDPFMGSGSTLKAALLENKTCIGIEMDPEYFAIAVERIKHVSPDSFTLESQS